MTQTERTKMIKIDGYVDVNPFDAMQNKTRVLYVGEFEDYETDNDGNTFCCGSVQGSDYGIVTGINSTDDGFEFTIETECRGTHYVPFPYDDDFETILREGHYCEDNIDGGECSKCGRPE